MLIAISQRRNPEYEGADVLEANYTNYYHKLGATLISIPNSPHYVENYFDQINIFGIILSGGGDVHPSLYGGDLSFTGNYSVEKDETERILLKIAIERGLPVLGICRGMEAININFGGKLVQNAEKDSSILNHRKTIHHIKVSESAIVNTLGRDLFEVNSHHNLCIGREQLSAKLIPFACAEDNTIEGIYHPDYPIVGIMWHPERKNPSKILDEFLLKAFFSKKLFWKNMK